MVAEAYNTLSNWKYTQQSRNLDTYEISRKHVFYGATLKGTKIVVVVFPEKGKLEPCAFVYFEVVDENEHVPVNYGYTIRSVAEIKKQLEENPADWLYEEG